MHGLAEGPALSDHHDISDLHIEGWRAVHWDVSVPFLVSVVFGDVVEVVATDHDGPLHLCADHNSLEDLAPDVHVASEGAFLINVLSLNSLFGGLEAEPHILEVSHTCAGLLGQQLLAVQEHILLFLEGSLVLRL